MLDQLLEFWPYVAALLDLVISLVASGHAVLSKRDTRAAIGWVGLIWLAPVVGTLLYFWLGINRIERRARSVRNYRRAVVPAAWHSDTQVDRQRATRLARRSRLQWSEP